MVGATTAVGAIDQGTTSTKGLVLATAGRLEVVANLRHRQFYPQLGWVEHDAGELLDRVHSAAEPVGDIAALERTRQLDSSFPTRQEGFPEFY
ncbi:MAG: FGGY family carbohydrate kinase [Kiloniellales bacterium]